MENAGLLSCANTRIGNGDDKKLLSGGERKRLAFATELLTDPIILFCDEPTTGLDSFGAQQLIQTLHNLAKKGTTILCTIHQPSSQLFSMFDNVLLLADGRIAFTGSPQQALQFFEDNGYHCPESYNPADFLIGILATDPGHERASERSAQYLCDLFAVSSAAKQRDTIVNLEIHMAEQSNYPFDSEIDDYKSPFWLTTIYWLWYRASLAAFRNPTVQTLRFFQKIVIFIFLCLNTFFLILLNSKFFLIGNCNNGWSMFCWYYKFNSSWYTSNSRSIVCYDIRKYISSNVFCFKCFPSRFSNFFKRKTIRILYYSSILYC